jgi:hypothetical protein
MVGGIARAVTAAVTATATRKELERQEAQQEEYRRAELHRVAQRKQKPITVC